MNSLATSRADIEIFGKVQEKEDIVPVDFEIIDNNISFSIKKTDFIYKLIKKSGVFAVNIPRTSFMKESDLCLINEGQVVDKFKLTGLQKIECDTIDCPAIDNSTIYECQFLKEAPIKDGVTILGKILVKRD